MAEEVGGLAEPVEPTADRNQLRHSVADAEPDEVTVARSRRDYEEYRRAHGEPDYQYPAHYLGPKAANYPPPGIHIGR